jgi:hypothetical protein
MENKEHKQEFLFEINYKILLIGIGVITLGFLLMSGGEVMTQTFTATLYSALEEFV